MSGEDRRMREKVGVGVIYFSLVYLVDSKDIKR